jgi:hypothetical protein
VDGKYEGDNLNGAYYQDLTPQITEEGPLLWVHGHMHDGKDYNIEKTRVVANPRGYVRHGDRENHEFDPEFTVEI